MIQVRVPAGIGDISWVYSKLSTIDEEIIMEISGDPPLRSHEYVSLLPKVREASYCSANYHTIEKYSIAANIDEDLFIEMAKNRFVDISLNRHLEQGKRIEMFMTFMGTDLNYEMVTTEEDKIVAQTIMAGKVKVIGIYTSNINTIRNWHGWEQEDWKKLIKKIKEFIEDVEFVIVGAKYDREMGDDIIKLLPGIKIYNACGETTVGGVVELIKSFGYFITYPCGLGVLANVVRTPVFMFYPKHLEKMQNTWARKEDILNGRYKGCQFCEPEKVMDWLVFEYKIQEK